MKSRVRGSSLDAVSRTICLSGEETASALKSELRTHTARGAFGAASIAF